MWNAFTIAMHGYHRIRRQWIEEFFNLPANLTANLTSEELKSKIVKIVSPTEFSSDEKIDGQSRE